MNGFSLTSDVLNLVASGIVLIQVAVKKDAQGISLKTQELILLASLLRCLSEPWNLISYVEVLYYVTVKAAVIIMLSAACFMMRHAEPTKSTYRADFDTVNHWVWIAVPCLVATLILTDARQHGHCAEPDDSGDDYHNRDVNSWWYIIKLMAWSFSTFLGATCLLPQMIVFRYHCQVDIKIGGILGLLTGSHHIFYICACINFLSPACNYWLPDNEHVLVFSLALLLLSAILGLFLQRQENQQAPSTPAAIMGCCRETPWRTILSVILFIPIYAGVITFPLVGSYIVSDRYQQEPLSSIMIAVGFIAMACNPIVGLCCCFFHFHPCSPRKSRKPVSQESDLEEQAASALPGDHEGVGIRDPVASISANRIAEEQRKLREDALEEVEEDEPLFSLSRSVRLISIILMLWATNLAFCLLSLMFGHSIASFFALLPIAGSCLYCCLPQMDEPEDLFLYEEVAEHELCTVGQRLDGPPREGETRAVSAPQPVMDDDKAAVDSAKRGLGSTNGQDALENPLLTTAEQRSASAALEKSSASGKGEYEAPHTYAGQQE